MLACSLHWELRLLGGRVASKWVNSRNTIGWGCSRHECCSITSPLFTGNFSACRRENGGRGKRRCLAWLENRLWPPNILVDLAPCATAGGVRAQGTGKRPLSKHQTLVSCSELSQQRFPFRWVLVHIRVVLDQSHAGSKPLTLNSVCIGEKNAF